MLVNSGIAKSGSHRHRSQGVDKEQSPKLVGGVAIDPPKLGLFTPITDIRMVEERRCFKAEPRGRLWAAIAQVPGSQRG